MQETKVQINRWGLKNQPFEKQNEFYKRFQSFPGENREIEERISKRLAQHNDHFVKGEIHSLIYKTPRVAKVELWKTKNGNLRILHFSFSTLNLAFPLKRTLSPEEEEVLNEFEKLY